MYTDDYRKRSYLDVHAFYVDRNFDLHHCLLAISHFGTVAHAGENVYNALHSICTKWQILLHETPVTIMDQTLRHWKVAFVSTASRTV